MPTKPRPRGDSTPDIHVQITAWVELIAVQLITPNASLVGHLTGVLAGPHLSLPYASSALEA
jgi:hypothetical protein